MFLDPLGLICPISSQPKLLFRNIVIQKCQWDTKVNIDVNNKWTLFLSELKTIRQIQTNRDVLCCDMLDVDLHGFGDAWGWLMERWCTCEVFVDTVLRLVCGLGNAVSHL